jgi:hypothetical protein
LRTTLVGPSEQVRGGQRHQAGDDHQQDPVVHQGDQAGAVLDCVDRHVAAMMAQCGAVADAGDRLALLAVPQQPAR